MNKVLKLILKSLGILVLLIILSGIAGGWYLNSTFLSFEEDNTETIPLQEIRVNGYPFLDRNGNGKLDPYEDDRLTTEERVEDLLNQMTLEEKIHILKGSGIASAMGMGNTAVSGAVGTLVPTPRLGIPTLYLSDGPAGLRINPTREGEDQTYYCTAFPIGSLLSSTWNTELVHQIGTAMGTEAREYGIDVILGPGANIHRHPLCGRNFEYYSEDPIVTGNIGAAMINGIESQGVGTSVKHFVANNQETDRTLNDALVSERALREIYLKSFEIIVKKSQPWTIMSSYNKINGTYVAEKKDLLTDILRGEWGYQGLVMTDWFGGNDAAAMIAAGNDLLEPGTNIQWKDLKEAAENGTLTLEEINTSARRILQLILQSKKMQNYAYSNNPDLDRHAKIARESATEGMVLLKNNNTLPIKKNQTVALLGVTSFDFIAGGTGSGDVNEAYTVSLEEGLINAGFEINITSRELFEKHKANFKEQFIKPQGLSAMTNPYSPPQITYSEAEIKDIVSDSDLGVITIGRNSGEGGDRIKVDDFMLSETEQNTIAQICSAFHAADKKVVVVLNIGGVIETASWKDQVDAILLAWQGGQEGGNSVADLLSGKVNPSGKLPMTFPIHLEDHASNANFPLNGGLMDFTKMLFGRGKEKSEHEKIKNKDFTQYEEGIYVGYRHFDKAELEVSYPFGFGLSYTQFELSDLTVNQEKDFVNLELKVINIGSTAGKEVVQVYSAKPDSSVDRPPYELKTFLKTPLLNPGDSTSLSLQIPLPDLSYWSEKKSQWILEKGLYSIHAGTSSRALPLTVDLEIN